MGYILTSTVVATLIASLTNLLIWRAGKKERDNDKKDNLEERVSKVEEHENSTDEKLEMLLTEVNDHIKETKDLTTAIIRSNKLLMCDRIKTVAQSKIRNGEISYEDRKLLHDMWDVYHKDWKGNGDLNLIMSIIDELPLEVK